MNQSVCIMAGTKLDYDYIVVGCGGIGSAAVYWLSRRAGNRVLGLEQFKLGHDNGGSQDHSRIIRLFYHDVKYTRLTPHTYECFDEVEKESGQQLVHKCGSLFMGARGTPGENIVGLYAKAMDAVNIKYERLSPSELRQRFPQFNPDHRTITLYEPVGGLVDAALSNSVHIQLAAARGATIKDHTPVTRIEPNADGTATVYTPERSYRCKKVIVTSGAWVNNVLSTVGVHIPVRVQQEQVTYFATPHVKEFTKDKCPIFFYNEHLDFYGLPMHVNSYTKIGIDGGGPVVTAESRNFDPDPVREQTAIDFLKTFVPKFLGPKMYTKTCLYTLTYDRDFVIDTLATRGKPQVVVCCGAGHAFKFTSLLGKILSEISIDGRTQYPIADFKLERPGVNNPDQFGQGVTLFGKSPL